MSSCLGQQYSVMVRSLAFGIQKTWVQITAYPVTCYVALGRSRHVLEPEFPHVHGTHRTRSCGGFKELLREKSLHTLRTRQVVSIEVNIVTIMSTSPGKHP